MSEFKEAETTLVVVEKCGFCNQTKRIERALSLNPEMCRCPSASDSTDPNIRVGSVPSSAFRSSGSIVPPTVGPVAETNVGLVEVVSVREKQGYFRKAIPLLPMPIAVILCILNAIVPGSGTLLSVFGVLCGCHTDHGSKTRSALISLLAAFMQLLTAPIIVGWIWSVLWGITFVNISAAKDVDHPTSML